MIFKHASINYHIIIENYKIFDSGPLMTWGPALSLSKGWAR
jgi:hypothetical protein